MPDLDCGRCGDCEEPLSPDEVYFCDDCAAFYAIEDPNFDMTGGDDEENQTTM